ncbi:quinon protein alcohol dehydrogenase-like superfamily [Schizophyllum commune]
MPRELPGLYFDTVRQRYFPLAQRPAGATTTTTTATTAASAPRQPQQHKSEQQQSPRAALKRRRAPLWDSSRALRNARSFAERERAVHNAQCLEYAHTSVVEQCKIPVFHPIRSFCSTTWGGQRYSFIGDSDGWLYSQGKYAWEIELNIHPRTEISSICASGSLCVATSSGPSTKISVQDLSTAGRTSLLTLNNVYDVRCSHLSGSSLVLGAAKQAVYLPDIANPTFQYLPTHSDVYAVEREQDLIYTGARNGSIHRFDMRMHKPMGDILFPDREPSNVVNLRVIRETQLLVNHRNGLIAAYDLRFPRESTPVMTYSGQVPSHYTLGFAVDPAQDFVFAAGDDRRIRAWSLRSGELLDPGPGQKAAGDDDDGCARGYARAGATAADDLEEMPIDVPTGELPVRARGNPFRTVFPDRVATMQVAEEEETGERVLWATSAGVLYRYGLGQRYVG